MVEFISYTGGYPNLCRGILILNINGKECRFGHDYSKFDSWKTDGNYDRFWVSGGNVSFDSAGYAYVDYDRWEYDSSCNLPDWLNDMREELIDCFNDNVEYGCCGGCI